MKKNTNIFLNQPIQLLLTIKKNNFLLFFLAFILLTYTIPYTAFAQKSKKEKAKKTKKISPKDEQRTQTMLFDALLAKTRSNTQKADTLLRDILKIDPNNDAALYELAKMSLDKKDNDNALLYIQGAMGAAPNNKWYKLLYANIQENNNKFEDAAQIYQQLIEKEPYQYEYYYDCAYMYIMAQKYPQAIEMYNHIEQKLGIMEEISIQKQRLYIQLNEVDKAAAEIEKLINNQPQNPRYYQLLAELYQANSKDAQAQATYQKLLAIAPNNPSAILANAQYYLKQGNKNQYFTEVKRAFAQPELSLDEKIRLLSPYLANLRSDSASRNEASELIQIVVNAHPNEALAHVLAADLLYAQKKPNEALTEYQKAITLNPNLLEAWQQIMFIQIETRQYQQLAENSKKAAENFPNQPLPFYCNGLANNALKDYEKAAKSLKKAALISGETNPEITLQSYSLLGEVYNSLKKYKDSDDAFDKALALKPEDVNVLNNYAYFLSMRKENLDKAEKMSLKSNQLMPQTASFLDTYAWVLYQQKKYNDAIKQLEKALENGGKQNATILEHYGDALFQVGKIEEAVKQWQQAKQANSEPNPTLDKKIKEKKIFE